MKLVHVPQYEQLADALRHALDETKSDHVYVLVCATVNPDTGKPWCPDCATADPVIKSVLGRIPDAILLECPVSRDSWKGNPLNPYRLDERLRVDWIPTLIRWQTPAEGMILIQQNRQLRDCGNLERLQQFTA